MKSNEIYKTIVELDGDCFSSNIRPPCQLCPFKDKCIDLMIRGASNIPKERRLHWAVDKLAEEYLLNDYNE